MNRVLLCLILAFTTAAVKAQQLVAVTDSLSYLAMGDSYTVGRLMPLAQTFPFLLAAKLNSKGIKTSRPVIVAQNGWRTDELLKAIKDTSIKHTYDFVTLLIGVNNHYQRKPIEVYRTEFKQLLDSAIAYAKGNAIHVIVLSIPDWGATPFATGRNPPKIAAEIDAYNDINKELTKIAGANYINITSLTRDVADSPDIYAPDKLHYSGKMYGWWADKAAAIVKKMIN
ncbi:SGNH/GDSL hydrolase family protein [Mucilaginibacter terrenus]|uniref:SGNH/GDSL hydrolase family protein n=1 Tax=Mucilaginibacter terrenus TaxID=2482727 RepID=A0A3E2NJL7_9SPHI|nr:GDSL-type esterase/lipase family protein [Mucilaginibacter terrenus]RFZ81192.1 SGNH/GDSL hydrolase family protein [Mucilaginibacter terrenus]